MSQSSTGYNEDDEEFHEDTGPGALPSRTEDRASANLESPDFEKSAEPAAIPAPSSFGTPMSSALADYTPPENPRLSQPAADAYTTPPTMQGAESPEVQSAIDQYGQAAPAMPMPHRGYDPERYAQAARQMQQQADAQQSGLHRYLASNGVAMETLPDGSQVVATHPDGAPKFMPEASAPFQDPETGRWLVRSRDERGRINDTDLVSTNKIHTDAASGSRYFIGQGGELVDIGDPDENVIAKNAVLSNRRELEAGIAAREAQKQQIHIDLQPFRDALSQLQQSPVPDGALGRVTSVKKMENRLLNLRSSVENGTATEDQKQSYQDAQDALERFGQDNPDYSTWKGALEDGRQKISAIDQATLQDRARRLQLAKDPRAAAAATAALPDSLLSGQQSSGTDASSADVLNDVAAKASDQRTTLQKALPAYLKKLKADGMQTVGGRPIDDEIARALNPPAVPERPVEEVPKAGIPLWKHLIGTAINNFGISSSQLVEGAQRAVGADQSADETAKDVGFRKELTTGQFSPDNPYRPGGPKDASDSIDPARKDQFLTGVASAAGDAPFLLAGPYAAVPAFTVKGAVEAGDEAAAKGEDRATGALKGAGQGVATLAAYMVGGPVAKALTPAIVRPVARALVSGGISTAVNSLASATASAVFGGSFLPRTPAEFGSRMLMDAGFGLHAAHESYKLPAEITSALNTKMTTPELIQLAQAKLAILGEAKDQYAQHVSDYQQSMVDYLTQQQQATQKFLDRQNPQLVAKLQKTIDDAVETARKKAGGDEEPPPDTTGEPAKPTPPDGGAPGDNAAPPTPASFRAKLRNADQLSSEAASANSDDLAATARAHDAVKMAQDDLHESAQSVTGAIPEDRRTAIARAVAPETSPAASERQFAESPTTPFLAAEVGRQMRDLVVDPARQQAADRLIGGDHVAQFVADQHTGMQAARDLVKIAKGEPVDPEKVDRFQKMGLVDAGEDGAPVVTDDAFPLLPKAVRDAAAAEPAKYRVKTTPGGVMDGAAALVRAGQEHLLDSLHGREEKARVAASVKPYAVRVQFSDAAGREREAVIPSPAHNDEQAIASATAKVEARGNKVTHAEVAKDGAAPAAERKGPKTTAGLSDFTPAEQTVLKAVQEVFQRNRQLLASWGLKSLRIVKNGDAESGLSTAGSGVVELDGERLREQFATIGEKNAQKWAGRALREEALHGLQFEVAKRRGVSMHEKYEAIRNDPSLDAGLIAKAAQNYRDFDQLEPWQQGAEIERMVLQQKWTGTITERILGSISDILDYLKGLTIDSPLLRDSIAQIESVRDEMRGKVGAEERQPTAKFTPHDEQAAAFRREAKTQQKGEREIDATDLQSGDLVQVGTESMEVVSVDADRNAFTLEDGKKYGTQQVEGHIFGKLESLGDRETKARQADEADRAAGMAEHAKGGHELLDAVKAAGGLPTLGNDPSLTGEEPPRRNAAGVEDRSLPKLRGRENQGDLLQGRDAPFNLAGETGVDHERVAREKAQADADKAEARAIAERQQPALFASKAAREKESARLEAQRAKREAWQNERDKAGASGKPAAMPQDDAAAHDRADASTSSSQEADDFKKWFRGSKVVDESGKPREVFHGTNAEFSKFEYGHANTVAPQAGMAHFFSDTRDVAGSYGTRVQSAFLSLKKPLVVDKRLEVERTGVFRDGKRRWAVSVNGIPGAQWLSGKMHMERADAEAELATKAHLRNYTGMEMAQIIEHAKASGHDGVIFKNIEDASYERHGAQTVYAVFDPEQIRIRPESRAPAKGAPNTVAQNDGIQPADEGPHPLTKPEGRSVINAYAHLARMSGFPAVNIADLADQSGVPMDKLKAQLLRSVQSGRAVLSTGDWSLADEKTRAGAIEYHGQKMLQARLISNEGLAASKAKARAEWENEPLPKKASADDVAHWNAQNEIKQKLYDKGFFTRNAMEDLRGKPLSGSAEADTESLLQQIGDKRFYSEIVDAQRDNGPQHREKFTPRAGDTAFDWALQHHGETHDLGQAGYILPDGRLLDFSESRNGGGGDRSLDHRGIQYPDRPSNGSDAMREFMEKGAVRIDANSGAVDIASKPTREQEAKIRRVLQEANGGVVDVVDGDRRAALEVTEDSIDKAMGRIRRFYSGEDIESGQLFASKAKAQDPDAIRAHEREKAQARVDAVRTKAAEKIGALRDKIGGMVSKTAAYTEVLRKAERAGAAGRKGGERDAKLELGQADRWMSADMASVKKDLVQLTESMLPPEERGHFISQIATVLAERPALLHGDLDRPFRKAAKLAGKIQARADEVYRKELADEIKETMKRAGDSPSVDVAVKAKMKALTGRYSFVKLSEAKRAELESRQRFVKQQELAGNPHNIPADQLAELKRLTVPHISELPTAALEALRDKVNAFENLGRLEVHRRAKLAQLELATDMSALAAEKSTPFELRPENADLPPLKQGEKHSLAAMDRIKNKVIVAINAAKTLGHALLPIDAVMDVLGDAKGAYNGFLFRRVRGTIDLDYNAKMFERAETYSGLDDLIKKHGLTGEDGRRIGILAAVNQEGGRERLVKAGIPEAHLDSIIRSLTPGEHEAYQYMRSAMDAKLPELRAMMRELYNEDVIPVENYFPMIRDWHEYAKTQDLPAPVDPKSGLPIRQDELATWKNVKEDARPTPRTNVEKGFTIERQTGAATPIRIDAFEVWRRHMDDVLHLIHTQRDLKRIGQVMRSEEAGAKFGRAGRQILVDWLDTVARNGGSEALKHIAWLDWLRQHSSVGMVGYRAVSQLKHISNAALAMHHVGLPWYIKGLSATPTAEAEAFMRRNMAETYERHGGEMGMEELTKFSKIANIGFAGARFFDRFNAQAVALGHYFKAMAAQGYPVAEALKANILNTRTKGQASPLDRAAVTAVQDALVRMRRVVASAAPKDAPQVLSRGTGMGGNVSVSRTMFQFGNIFLDRWSNISHDFFGAGVKKRNYGQAATVALGLLTAIAAESGITLGMRSAMNTATGNHPPDDDGYVKEMLEHAVKQFPFMGQLMGAWQHGGSGIPVVDAGGQILSSAKRAVEAKSGRAQASGAIRAAGGAAALIGVPGAGQASDIAAKLVAGKEENEVQRLMREHGIKHTPAPVEGAPQRKDLVAAVRAKTATPAQVYQSAVKGGMKPEQARAAVIEGQKPAELATFERLPLATAIEVYRHALSDPKVTPETRKLLHAALQKKHAAARG